MKKGKQKSDKKRVELTTAKILLLIAIVELLRKLIEFAQYLLEMFVHIDGMNVRELGSYLEKKIKDLSRFAKSFILLLKKCWNISCRVVYETRTYGSMRGR